MLLLMLTMMKMLSPAHDEDNTDFRLCIVVRNTIVIGIHIFLPKVIFSGELQPSATAQLLCFEWFYKQQLRRLVVKSADQG